MRLPQIDPNHLSREQRELWEKIASGPRGGVRGPYFALLHSPRYCAEFESLGRFLRYECSVPHPLRELAILVVARRWKAQYEWFAHAPIAAKAGIAPAVIEAIRTGATPVFARDEERIVYEYVHEVMATGFASEARHKAANTLLGDAGIVELIGLVGQYVTVALTLNVFEIGVPEGTARPFD